MSEPVLLVVLERDPDGSQRALAPAVGWWTDRPRPGTVVGPGSGVGWLQVLTRRYRLVVPDGPAGTLEREVRGAAPGVGFGELLFTIREPSGEAVARQQAGAQAGEELPDGTYALRSPTDGLFYRRPGPDAPPFVVVGTRVASGQPVGLVEVMKTFNHVTYGGAGLPEEAEVVEVRCEDGVEVTAGQILLLVR